MTSSARTIRRPLLGRMPAAAPGSSVASLACSSAGPRAASSASRRSRTAGSVPGKFRSSRAARRYSPEPPTRIGTRPRAVDLGDGVPGHPLVFGHVRGVPHVPHVEQMMRDALALGDGELGRADVHAPVQLHGVGVDDLAAELTGQPQREIGLARPRWGRAPRSPDLPCPQSPSGPSTTITGSAIPRVCHPAVAGLRPGPPAPCATRPAPGSPPGPGGSRPQRWPRPGWIRWTRM